jgi:hypothetical protein
VVLYNYREEHKTNTDRKDNTMKYHGMTNAELYNIYNASRVYEPEMCKEICSRVGMYEDYYYANSENVDRVMDEAVEQLKASV